MEDCSSHVSSSFFSSATQQFGVDNETDEISSPGIKGEPSESLNDFQIAGADSNTEIGGCKSEPSPAERQRKRKHYEKSKGYMEKIKKTCEKIADIEGALLEERDGTFNMIENILQKQRDETFAMIKRLKEAQQKRDGNIAFKLKRLKKELERLRARTTRSEEERGLVLSVHRQQLKPQSFTLQIPTFSSMEIAASHPISNGCADGADILTKLEADEQSNVRLSDFAGLGGERRPVGKYNFPPLLHQIVKNITEVYGDVSAASRLSVSLTGEFYVVFCASIKEMSELRLEQVTENMILKWRDAIKDALRVRFKVDFAMEHLKKVTCAYIGLMERRKLDSMASKISNLEAQLSVGKAEYCKISEMSKIYIDAADEFTGKAVSWGIFESSY